MLLIKKAQKCKNKTLVTNKRVLTHYMGTHDLQNIFKGHSCPSKFKNYLQEMASIEMGGF